MERYTITLVNADSTTQLLIPLPPASAVSALIAQVRRRATKLPKYSGWQQGEISLRVEAEDGPMLDEDDMLQDVVIDPKGTKVFAACVDDGPRVMEVVSQVIFSASFH